jgi:hypothetical protein
MYQLVRVADQFTFAIEAANDTDAMIELGGLAGERLTFDGDGDAPYLLELAELGSSKKVRPVFRRQ